MFQSPVAKLPFGATKTIIRAFTRFNNGLNIKTIATAAAPPPSTAFVVQKAMPTNYAFSQSCFKYFYGMQQNLRHGAGLTKAPYLYTGYVREIDGQPHGFGMKSSAHHSRARVYKLYEEGEWRNGKLNGHAVRMRFFFNGWVDTCAGLFVDGEPSKCRVINNVGVIFEGVFEGGDPKNGSFFTPEGVVEARVEETSDYYQKQLAMRSHMKEMPPYYFPDGTKSTYTGLVLRDSNQECGPGKRKFDDGELQEGEFFDGNLHGYGRCKYALGGEYIGQFAGGKKSGRGLHIGSTNDDTDIPYYFGEWENDLPNGHGAHVLRDGSVYVGQFKDGVAQG